VIVAGVVVCRLSSSVIPAHMQRNSPGATRDGRPVVLRPVRATPCLNKMRISTFKKSLVLESDRQSS